jgi:formylglycine-generating enzyme required for sulfatase activity
MKTTSITLKTLTLATAAVALTPPAEGASPMNIETVLISGASVDDTTGYGGVTYNYHISKYEVTQGQWVEFLNAVATDMGANSNIQNLWTTSMDNTAGGYSGISRDGSGSNYVYSVADEYKNRPVVYVSLFDAKRFCNWLTSGGLTTETGIYDMSLGNENGTRDVDAWTVGGFALPTENEWYKAAYYDPNKDGGAGYYIHSTTGSANTGGIDSMMPEYANCARSYLNGDGGNLYRLNEVTFYKDYASAYGVVDMTGNVWEWTDSYDVIDYRVVRGPSFYDDYDAFLGSALSRTGFALGVEYGHIGFRVASLAPIPEPSTYGVIGGALVGLLCLVRRKRRAVAAH